MCQYRYYYFPSCRHQQTVLFAYCENATYEVVPPRAGPDAPAAAAQAFSEVGAERGKKEPAKRREKSKKTWRENGNSSDLGNGGGKGNSKSQGNSRSHGNRPGRGVKKSTKKRRLPQPSQTALTATQLRDPGLQQYLPSSSSSSIGSASVTEEPAYLDASSSLPQQPLHEHYQPPAAEADDMAGLRPFGQSFRHWVEDSGTRQGEASGEAIHVSTFCQLISPSSLPLHPLMVPMAHLGA